MNFLCEDSLYAPPEVSREVPLLLFPLEVPLLLFPLEVSLEFPIKVPFESPFEPNFTVRSNILTPYAPIGAQM